jgi:guanidinoacetate N-methyltransferase
MTATLTTISAKQYPSTPAEWVNLPAVFTDSELTIGEWQVMQTWERPLMGILAKAVASSHGDILEVGFGMGLSAQAIVDSGCRSYTVIEAHPTVAQAARAWAARQPVPTRIIQGFWQDVVPELEADFDGILFDTYPLTVEERHCNHYPFIPVAPRLLRTGGTLTYYSDETQEFRAEHLALLLNNFADVRLIRVDGLQPFEGCEYWGSSHMVVPIARKAA